MSSDMPINELHREPSSSSTDEKRWFEKPHDREEGNVAENEGVPVYDVYVVNTVYLELLIAMTAEQNRSQSNQMRWRSPIS